MGDKIKTVIASVLKPVDDTRMYEKFGQSLQQTNRYEVNIIGFISKNPPEDRDIIFHQIFNFSNRSWKRLFAPLKFGKKLFKITPKLIIVTTYELLPIAILYKFLKLDVKVVYDIQENYALNILSNLKKNALSNILSLGIRGIEKYSQHFISLNLLAESGYAKEISFPNQNYQVISNKYAPIPVQAKVSNTNLFSKSNLSNRYPILLFNGTISDNYGILEAIHLAKKLKVHFPDILLIVVGHVTKNYLLKKLVDIQDKNSWIYSMIDTKPIPHAEIIQYFEWVDFGLVAHQAVDSIKNCFPTRIYEYMAHKIPFILEDHPYWTDYCNPWNCSINIKFKNFDTQLVAQQIKTRQFYTHGLPNDIFWTQEALQLIKAMDKLFCINHS